MFELAPTGIRSLLGRSAMDFADADQTLDEGRVWYRGRKKARAGTQRTLWPPARKPSEATQTGKSLGCGMGSSR
jgi:hypothetical protein